MSLKPGYGFLSCLLRNRVSFRRLGARGAKPRRVFGFGRRSRGGGKVENLLLVFHFSMAAKPGCGNVGISRFLRDFQGTVEGVGKLLLLFHSFHGPGISTALRLRYRNGGGSGDCILHWRSSCDLAAFICRAQSVSLRADAQRSNFAAVIPCFNDFSHSGRDLSFSYGVR